MLEEGKPLISYAAAYAYLDHDRYHNLMHLGALDYEPVQAVYGVEQDGTIDALAIVVGQPDPQVYNHTTIMLAASGVGPLERLLAHAGWPTPATWAVHRHDLLAALEQQLDAAHDPNGGSVYAIASTPPDRPHPLVRQLTLADADALDLTPCSLSPTALRNWLRRGWHAFGAVRRNALVCHALAAYPIGDTEEVAAVYTAPQARRQGIASAVVAAAIADIMARDHRAVYATRKTNIASRRVAAGLGLAPLFETWEIPR